MPVPIQPAVQLHASQPVHFIGAGGIGMSGLAKILLQAGFAVTGSDKRDNAQLQRLRDLGGTMTAGHAASNVPETALVVCSTAIAADNPEVAVAQQRGQTVIHRATLLRAILNSDAFPNTITVGITGSHGKTSTTGMVTAALMGGGLQPTAIAGGLFPERLESPLTNAISGKTIAVAELDESDGSLEAYAPDITVLLNLEMDHAEHFPGGMPELRASIQRFVVGLAADNKPRIVIANLACDETAAVVANAPPNVTVIGFNWGTLTADYYGLTDMTEHQPGRFAGTVMSRAGEPMGRLSMQAPGQHQLGNGAVAFIVAECVKQLGQSVDLAGAAEGINAFTGMGRRFEVVGNHQGALLVDDYAHHPTEIAAMLQVGQQVSGPNGRLFAVFEPHRYSRLQQFWVEFQVALAPATELWVTDVYEASEPPRDGITSPAFIAELRERYPTMTIHHLPKAHWARFLSHLPPLTSQDVVMTLGAGDVTHLLRAPKSCQVGVSPATVAVTV